jgi:hypothetical protein
VIIHVIPWHKARILCLLVCRNETSGVIEKAMFQVDDGPDEHIFSDLDYRKCDKADFPSTMF